MPSPEQNSLKTLFVQLRFVQILQASLRGPSLQIQDKFVLLGSQSVPLKPFAHVYKVSPQMDAALRGFMTLP